MSLGEYKFTVNENAWNTIKKNASFRWAELKRLGGKSILQFMGNDSPTMSIDCTLYQENAGSPDVIFSKMLEIASEGKPLILVDLNGINYGKWVITSLANNSTQYDKWGNPHKSEFTLELKGYEHW